MIDEGPEPSDAVDVDERVVEFLRTADRPRHLASEVSEALDLARGRVRTRLQALADDGRVVRTDAERTARWAVPGRADEPEPGSDREHAADDGAADVDATDEPEADDAVDDEDPDTGRGDEDADRAGDATGGGNEHGTGGRENTDAPATAEGPAGVADRSTDDAGPEPRSAPAGDGKGGRRWRGPAGGLALLVGLAVALVVLGRLRRR